MPSLLGTFGTTVTSTTSDGCMYYDSAWNAWVATGTTETTTSITAWISWTNAVHDEVEACERARQRKEADARAEELLLQLLTPAQRALYRSGNLISVKGGRSGQEYRIDTRYHSRNIWRSDGRRFCAHPPLDVPRADIILAQKLAIEYNEDHFLQMANVS